MKEDRWRLAGLVAAGLVLGWPLGHPALGIAVGLAIYTGLLVRDSRRALDWLRHHRDEPPPVLGGYMEGLIMEVEKLHRYHRQREEKLSLFLKRFQQATSALPDAILILDPNDHIEWANTRARDYLGIRWPQDAGQRLANLIRHPELIEYLKKQALNEDLSTVTLASPEDSGLHIEFRVIPYGNNLRLLVARDVTRIHQINQMRRDFIANASHELRTPLTVIAGYLESMDGDLESSAADLQPQIRQMRKQTARMQTLIEDLLMLSSLETRKAEHSDEVVAVPDMLSGIYREALTLSGEKNHIFAMELDQELHLHGNHKELYSAFSNLVVNAVQYTPSGGIIRIRWYADDAGAHMKVSDTGDGIAPEHIPRLTERFYRVDKGRSRESGGTGLGLAIVKHIMTRHGGHLHIESEIGKGSIFRCDFPAEAVVREAESYPRRTNS
ncbi:MAG: phosphate regulon sensor histidine kinase PhoR [Gammaproteobacteria bacterium]|nr:phosphate regulon sensor histidine kinase PhoR [Gammaproteobacteria bacterium]